MKIQTLHLHNFKGYADFEIQFEKNLTVIIGENGAGKSSVLEAISIPLSWIIARIKKPLGQGLFIAQKDIRNGEKYAQVQASFDLIDNIMIPSKTSKGKRKSNAAQLESLKEFASKMRDKIECNSHYTLPTFAHYNVQRAVVDVPLRIRKNHIFDTFETYENFNSGNANFRSFFE